MRLAIYIEPWISQRAGIAVFTENLVREAEKSRSHEYVLIGSENVDSKLETIIIAKRHLSFFNPVRQIGDGYIDLSKYGIDWLIDTAHYATQGVLKAKDKLLIVHDLTALNQAKYHRWTSVLAHKLWLKKSIESASRIVTVSDQTAKDVSSFADVEHKMTTIYPGLKQQLSRSRAGVKLAIQKTDYFLCVGTIEPRKNHKTTIQAFDKYCEKGGICNLIIVGDRGWKVNINALIAGAKHPSRIKYQGFVSNETLFELYENAVASVYVSYYEGFGFPILESMSLGCPVITSNLGSMKEIGEGAAILVNPESVDEISDAMTLVASNNELRSIHQKLGMARADEFTWKAFLKRLEAVID